MATHQVNGLPESHPCAKVHAHRWIVEIVLSVGVLVPTDGPSELTGLEPLRLFIESELNDHHLNDILVGQPTPARVARHIASWCQTNLPDHVANALFAIAVGADSYSRARYVIPRQTRSSAH